VDKEQVFEEVASALRQYLEGKEQVEAYVGLQVLLKRVPGGEELHVHVYELSVQKGAFTGE